MGKNELPDQVRVTFQLERGEYIRGVRYYLRKSHLVSWVQVLVMLFLFTQEDVARQDETAAALLDWDIKKLWRGPEFYYLFGSSEGYTLLPLRAFQDEEARLRFESLAQEANPDMIFRHFG